MGQETLWIWYTDIPGPHAPLCPPKTYGGKALAPEQVVLYTQKTSYPISTEAIEMSEQRKLGSLLLQGSHDIHYTIIFATFGMLSLTFSSRRHFYFVYLHFYMLLWFSIAKVSTDNAKYRNPPSYEPTTEDRFEILSSTFLMCLYFSYGTFIFRCYFPYKVSMDNHKRWKYAPRRT